MKVGGVNRDIYDITSLLIGTLYTSGADFDARYDPLSEKADLVVYNGHSELSKNTNALARKGKVAPKQYQMFFFDSCDTYAYLDTKLVDRRREVNGADDRRERSTSTSRRTYCRRTSATTRPRRSRS